MSRFTLLLLLCLSVTLSVTEARPSDRYNHGGQNNGFHGPGSSQDNQGGHGGHGGQGGGHGGPPGQVNGGDSSDCPSGYTWNEWRGECVRLFG